jgi:hypothetical protein
MHIRHDRNATNRPFRTKYSVGAGDGKLSKHQSVSRLKANVPSALSRFTRGQLSNVFGDAAGGHIRAQRQRTLNGNSFIIQDRNLEGYPRAAD